MLYYAPILFVQAGLTSTKASFLSSGVIGIVMLLCTIPAQIWIDRWGRRKPLILGGTIMAVCFIVIGSLYVRFGTHTSDGVTLSSHSARWAVIVLIFIFVANFSWSWAVVGAFVHFLISTISDKSSFCEQVGKIYASEIIPTRLRAKVSAVELLANWIVNFVVTLTAPIWLSKTPAGPYFLYGFSTLVAVAVCVVMPETKGRSLEAIEKLFEKSHNGPS